MPSFDKITASVEDELTGTEHWWNDTSRGNWNVEGGNADPLPLFQTSNLQKVFYNSYRILGQVNKWRWDGGWGLGGQVARTMELEMHTGFWMGNLKITTVFWNTEAYYGIILKCNLQKQCLITELNETGTGILSNGWGDFYEGGKQLCIP